jgi:hypothetical protein
MQDFPLQLIEDFLGLFSPLTGTANADIQLKGTASDPEYKGYLRVSDAEGRFLFNNMDYRMSMDIEADGRQFTVNDLTIRNLPKDWTDGSMTATGRITTEAFAIDEFDLTMRGRLKVLRNASRAALEMLYGDLYISTNADGLSYSGRLDRSLFRGDIIVERGELFIPSEQSGVGEKTYSDIRYVVVDDTTRELTTSLSSARLREGSLRGESIGGGGESVTRKPEGSIVDGLTYDLTISTKGRLRVEMPFTLTQEVLNSTLDITDLKVNNWGGGGGKFVGTVHLAKGSYMVFLGKRLETTGSLTFTREPMNPDLNLEAVYTDYYDDPATSLQRRVYVKIMVTGTKQKPEIAFDLRWDEPDGEPISRSGEADADAVSFMLFGMFPRDINSQGTRERSSLAEKTPELANALGSSLLSSTVNQFISRAGLKDYIKRIEFANVGTQDTRVQVTTEIGQAIVTYDGRIDNLASSNVSLDFPIENILGLPWANFILRFTRRTVDEFNQGQPQENFIHEFKILQRIAF